MAVEARRGCGYRVCGALYLVCDAGAAWSCGRLPLPTDQPQRRTVVTLPIYDVLIPGSDVRCRRLPVVVKMRDDRNRRLPSNAVDSGACPRWCWAKWPPTNSDETVGLLWVGEAFYTLDAFLQEAEELGVSKRVPKLPQDLLIGRTGVFLAHKSAYRYQSCRKCGRLDPRSPCCDDKGGGHNFDGPGIFAGFVPQRVECLVEDDRLGEPWVQELRERGVTIIEVPADDPDHARPRPDQSKSRAQRKKRGGRWK